MKIQVAFWEPFEKLLVSIYVQQVYPSLEVEATAAMLVSVSVHGRSETGKVSAREVMKAEKQHEASIAVNSKHVQDKATPGQSEICLMTNHPVRAASAQQ